MNESMEKRPRDMDAIHERIISAAEASERLPEVNLEEISRIASKAYLDALQAGEGIEQAEARARAMSAIADSSLVSAWMLTRAVNQLDDEGGLPEVRPRPAPEFAFNFLFAALVPILGGAGMWWLGRTYGDAAANAVFAALCLPLILGTLASILRGRKVAATGEPRRASSAILVHSGGAMMAGLFVLFGVAVLVHRDGQREFEIGLTKVNQAAAVTLAALQVGASASETQDVVNRLTSTNWIRVEPTLRAGGGVLAIADLRRTTTRRLQLVSESAESPTLVSYLMSSSGETVPYADYVVGTVLEADFDKVTLKVANETSPRVFRLPRGTLPPSKNSHVVAAIDPTGKAVVFLQPIDSLVLELKR